MLKNKKGLEVQSQYSHIDHCLMTIGKQLDTVINVGTEISNNSNYTKMEINHLKTLIDDLSKVKGALNATTALLQNTLIPNLENMIINIINNS